MPDNKQETIDDLRHQHQKLKNTDLESTCQKQPQLELDVMNETDFKNIHNEDYENINKLLDKTAENEMKKVIAKLEEENVR